MHRTHLHLWTARVSMVPCGCKERDEGHYTSKKYEGTEKGIRCWRMGSRMDGVNETQLKAEEKERPTTKVSGTNVEKYRGFSCPEALNHGVVMQCYVCNANRRIFQVT